MAWTPAQQDAFAAYVDAPQHLPNVLRLVASFQDDAWYAWTAGWLRDNGWGQVLDARPRLAPHPLDWYGAHAAGTLGRAYHTHLTGAGIDPRALRLPPQSDARGWLRARTYETHDIVHTVCGFSTSGVDEVAVLSFIAAQCPARHTLALVAGAVANAADGGFVRHDGVLDGVTRGCLLARGSVPFLTVDWDALWDVPLDEVRARVGVRMARLAALD